MSNVERPRPAQTHVSQQTGIDHGDCPTHWRGRLNKCGGIAGQRIDPILDDGGHLLYFARMTDCHAGTAEVAIAKAATAVPSQTFAQGVADGTLALLAMPGLIPFPGGIPLLHKETLMGAIGVSGAAPDVYALLAMVGAAVLERATAPQNSINIAACQTG